MKLLTFIAVSLVTLTSCKDASVENTYLTNDIRAGAIANITNTSSDSHTLTGFTEVNSVLASVTWRRNLADYEMLTFRSIAASGRNPKLTRLLRSFDDSSIIELPPEVVSIADFLNLAPDVESLLELSPWMKPILRGVSFQAIGSNLLVVLRGKVPGENDGIQLFALKVSLASWQLLQTNHTSYAIRAIDH